jgi:outer membrane usher protein FimD/PapC
LPTATAFNLGVGKNMGEFGAVSLDVTQANATPDDSASGAVAAFSL